MPYEFITYEIDEGKKTKRFEMLHVNRQGCAAQSVRKVIGPSVTDIAFEAHSIFDVRAVKDTNLIIPSTTQRLFDPITLGNAAFIGMIKILNSGETVIMNSKGGYQIYKPELLTEMGWKEISREERKELSFKTFEK
jgi:hypothetical protein